MIQPHQYLRDIYSMSEKEKEVLAKRVYSIGADDNSLDYDLQTLSALSRAHGFISVAHQLDSDRVWREMQGFVKIMKGILPQPQSVTETEHDVAKTQESVQKKTDSEKKSQKGVQSAKNNAGKSANKIPSETGAQGGDRPKHYDQWFEQMSEGLQAKIATLPDLHTKRKYYRELVEKLADNPNHSKQDMSLAATLTVNYEKKIQAIYDQAQIEWDELQGRSVSDEVKRIALQDEQKADKEIRKAEGDEPSDGADTDSSTHQDTEATNTQATDQAPTKPASQMNDDELKELTVAQVQASDLPDGPKQYLINKRVELARGYLKKMTPESMDEAQKQKAIGYAQELAHAGKTLSPKAKENMEAAGIKPE